MPRPARIWSRTTSGAGYGGTAGCNLALAWGQDTRTASGGAPGLDVGTSVPPLRLVESSKSLTLKTDNDGDGQLSPGDVATYLITVKNAGPTTVNNVYVYDTVPANTTYVQNTTGWATAVGGPWTAIADAPNPGDLPLSQAPNGVYLGSLASNNSFFVRFDVTLGTGAYGEINNCSVAGTDAGNLALRDQPGGLHGLGRPARQLRHLGRGRRRATPAPPCGWATCGTPSTRARCRPMPRAMTTISPRRSTSPTTRTASARLTGPTLTLVTST
ncbi:MAG: DUF11 domain-containing protein [Anaerolineae bacterium]|nr:MAG: DUF11 domain-containing protein [Anaerolineae bacterium]